MSAHDAIMLLILACLFIHVRRLRPRMSKDRKRIAAALANHPAPANGKEEGQ